MVPIRLYSFTDEYAAMNKLLIKWTICALLSVGIKASAQVSIGIVAGPCLMGITGNRTVDEQMGAKLAFYAGLSSQVKVYRSATLDIGLMYERKGSRLAAVMTDPQGNKGKLVSNINLDYITLPVLAGIRRQFTEHICLYMGIGGYTGYLVHHGIVNKSDFAKQYPPDSQQSLLRDFDFGLSAAAKGYYALKNNLALSMGLTYALGLRNISAAVIADGGQLNTRAAGFQVGLHWGAFLQ
jgi:hypothetical protein